MLVRQNGRNIYGSFGLQQPKPENPEVGNGILKFGNRAIYTILKEM